MKTILFISSIYFLVHGTQAWLAMFDNNHQGVSAHSNAALVAGTIFLITLATKFHKIELDKS